MVRAMSSRHCANIRKLPCLRCGIYPAGTIHHLKEGTGERGIGMRSSDRHGVPLCGACHFLIEQYGSRREGEIFRSWGIADVLAVSAELWEARANPERMFAIVQHHRTGLPL